MLLKSKPSKTISLILGWLEFTSELTACHQLKKKKCLFNDFNLQDETGNSYKLSLNEKLGKVSPGGKAGSSLYNNQKPSGIN